MRTIFRNIYALELYRKFYFAGAAILALSMAFFCMRPQHESPLLNLGMFIFGLGFSIWSIPILKKFWERPIGKLVISIAQFLIYLLATAFARQLVASALGLPAQDFDLTISFLTVLFYIPAATLVLSVVTGAAALLFQLRMMVSSLKYSLEQAAHFLGAVALMISLSMVYSFVMKNQFALYPMTKRIAFDFDYELIPNYPAVEHDKKIRLHKNGVVSQAELKENDVVISVGRIQQ